MKAWQRAVAQYAHSAWNLPVGIHPDFQGKRVNRCKEVVLVGPTLEEQHAAIESGKPTCYGLPFGFYVHAWPMPIHFSHFEEAAKGVKPGGPAQLYPGSIGSMRVEGAYVQSEDHPLQIKQVQSHFRTTETEHPLPRKLANRYKKWRLRAFEEVLRIAKYHNVGVKVEKKILYTDFIPGRSTPISRAHDDLMQAAAKVGFKIKEEKFPRTTAHKSGEVVLLLMPK